MKPFLLLFCLFLFVSACGSKNSNSDSTSPSKESSSDPCEDMRSYNAGIDYGKNDKKGAEISGNPISTCDGVLQYYDDNYNKECFCTGFYKGQSEN